MSRIGFRDVAYPFMIFLSDIKFIEFHRNIKKLTVIIARRKKNIDARLQRRVDLGEMKEGQGDS